MYNENKKFTRLILEQKDLRLVYEVPYDDVSGDDMVQALRTIMIGMSFCDDTVLASFARYVNEHGFGKYEIREISENN